MVRRNFAKVSFFLVCALNSVALLILRCLLFSLQALNLRETKSCVCWALRHVTCGQFAEVSVAFLVFSKVQLVRCRREISHLGLAGENVCVKGFSGAGSVSGFSLSELTHLDGLLFQMVKNT